MDEMKVSQMSIFGTEHAHGRDADAVLEGKPADLKRGKERRFDLILNERCARHR
jgi:hypothetical protein